MKSNYFNFTADAVGYINEIKEVTPKKGDAFVALKVCLLEGENGANRVYADLICRGKQALEVVCGLPVWPGEEPDGPAFFAGFRIGSLDAKPYLSRDGHPKAVLSGRLLAIKHLKIGEEPIEVPEWRTGTEDTHPQPESHEEQPDQPQAQSQRPRQQPQTQPQRPRPQQSQQRAQQQPRQSQRQSAPQQTRKRTAA